MSWFYRHLLRPLLFTQEPEQVHNRTMRGLAWAGRHQLVAEALASFFGAPELPVELFGLRFPNPVGLAAGMDKQAEALPAWPALGFGFTELGAVTWHAQAGNPAPRLFRVIPDEAIINRMGFNNPGAEAVAEKLSRWRAQGHWPQHPVGMNLGKSKITPLDQAPEDYAKSLRVLLPHLDFFVVNVSSPNTPNLRQLQDKAALDEILAALEEVLSGRGQGAEVRDQRSEIRSQRSEVRDQRSEVSDKMTEHATLNTQHATRNTSKPILVKVAPDLSFEALDDILEVAERWHVAGIVATNTTVTRPQSGNAILQGIYAEAGGLSGRPLRARSTEVIRHLYRQTRGSLPIIGVGGIFNAADAWEKILAGASLVQVYTGLVFEGPGLARSIVTGLRQHLERAGFRSLQEAVGHEATAPKCSA
jgi:dihydroorotate dehydrogenase